MEKNIEFARVYLDMYNNPLKIRYLHVLDETHCPKEIDGTNCHPGDNWENNSSIPRGTTGNHSDNGPYTTLRFILSIKRSTQ